MKKHGLLRYFEEIFSPYRTYGYICLLSSLKETSTLEAVLQLIGKIWTPNDEQMDEEKSNLLDFFVWTFLQPYWWVCKQRFACVHCFSTTFYYCIETPPSESTCNNLRCMLLYRHVCRSEWNEDVYVTFVKALRNEEPKVGVSCGLHFKNQKLIERFLGIYCFLRIRWMLFVSVDNFVSCFM